MPSPSPPASFSKPMHLSRPIRSRRRRPWGDYRGIVAPGCHECACEDVFADVMERVPRVKNMCHDDVYRVEDFRSSRRRKSAISADYARIYLQPLGESMRLKFAGGAAFGSTHIGYAMDLAADTLEGWGSMRGNRPADLLMPDGTAISPD